MEFYGWWESSLYLIFISQYQNYRFQLYRILQGGGLDRGRGNHNERSGHRKGLHSSPKLLSDIAVFVLQLKRSWNPPMLHHLGHCYKSFSWKFIQNLTSCDTRIFFRWTSLESTYVSTCTLTCETYREKILKMSTFKIIPPKFYPEDLRISGILKTKPQILRFHFEDLGYSDVTSTFEDLRIRGFFRCMFRMSRRDAFYLGMVARFQPTCLAVARLVG